MKNNRGSLTIIAIFTILIFSLYGILLYARSASAYIRQTKSIETIQAIYAQDVLNAARIAEQLEATSSEILENGEMIVTFNANGGTVNVKNKKVRYDEAYGDLPVPTREGYTFKGWNGKNKFNEDSILSEIGNFENGYWTFSAANGHRTYYSGIPQITHLKENTQYTLSIKGYSINARNQTNFRIAMQYGEKIDNYIDTLIYVNGSVEKLNVGTSHENQTIKKIYMTYGWGGTVYISHVQLEEGNVVTEYEPYYIIPSTKVVQQNNHTLTAIWEENS